jgi:hypothetical protein
VGKRNTIALRTDLNMEECLRRLREGGDVAQRAIFSLSGYKGSKAVLSKFDRTKFKLWKRRRWSRYDFSPFFSGTLSPEGNGTRIEGNFGTSPLVKVYLIVWLTLAVVFSLPFFLGSLAHTIRGTDWPGIAIPLGVLTIGVLMPRIGRLTGRREERFVLEFLVTTLEARTDGSRLSLSGRTVENVPL